MRRERTRVAIQLKIFTPVGIAIQHRVIGERGIGGPDPSRFANM